jgi:RNA polymerase sigma factor (TIGR02999 family)
VIVQEEAAAEVTELLRAWRRGEARAGEDLLRRVYGELERIAAGQMRRERPEHTLEPRALVHEAFLRLVDQRRLDWRDRAHFFGLAAATMRRVLVDHARARATRKRRRDDGAAPLTLTVSNGPAAELLDLDRALADFALRFPRPARVVEMRYFGDFEIDQIAACLEISPATVKRDWQFARAWLREALREPR